MDESQQPGILISQIFLDRAQFGHREDALALAPNTPFQPNLAVQIQGGASPDEKMGFVRITVRTNPEDRPLYTIEVTMTAIFQVDQKHKNLALKDFLRTAAPVMLYPFVREAVASLTWRGRFGPVWLAPFNVKVAMAHATDWTAVPGAPPEVERPSKRVKKAHAKVRS